MSTPSDFYKQVVEDANVNSEVWNNYSFLLDNIFDEEVYAKLVALLPRVLQCNHEPHPCHMLPNTKKPLSANNILGISSYFLMVQRIISDTGFWIENASLREHGRWLIHYISDVDSFEYATRVYHNIYGMVRNMHQQIRWDRYIRDERLERLISQIQRLESYHCGQMLDALHAFQKPIMQPQGLDNQNLTKMLAQLAVSLHNPPKTPLFEQLHYCLQMAYKVQRVASFHNVLKFIEIYETDKRPPKSVRRLYWSVYYGWPSKK